MPNSAVKIRSRNPFAEFENGAIHPPLSSATRLFSHVLSWMNGGVRLSV